MPLFHDRFAALAVSQGSSIAVEDGRSRLDYRSLDEQSNRLAQVLIEEGVAAETPVIIELGPSSQWVVALLAVWKAGGACLTVDPALPEARKRFLLEDARAGLVIDRGWLESRSAKLASLAPSRPRCDIAAEQLAYLMYTSGSTGRPKGVAVMHRGLANLAAAQLEILGVGPGDRVLQLAPTSFDGSIAEVAMALGSGATLVLAARAVGPALLEGLRRERITVVTLPPSLLAALSNAELPELRRLFVAGEACPAELAWRWAPGREMLNLYGPTEATVWSSWARLVPGNRPTIGRAIPGVELSILDEEGRPADEGELWIGGAGVARGYLGLPELTRERFLAGRYRSGDRVRRLPDGDLEFLGRLDEQVQIGGCRVEPGEVKAALLGIQGVREAAVIPRSSPSGWLLEAHVAASDLTIDALRTALAAALPAWLLPARLRIAAELPRTAAGKIDRQALPQIAAAEGTLPAGESEAWLATTLGELLGQPRVSLDGDFLSVGGTSLVAARLLGRMLAERSVELSYTQLFECVRLAELAPLLGTARLEAPVASEEPVLSFGQERLWFSEQMLPGHPGYHAPLFIQLRGKLAEDAAAVRRAVQAVVERHAVLRSTFSAPDGRPRATIHAAFDIELPVHDGLSEAEARRRALEEAQAPFDLARGPLLRASLFRLGPEQATLALTFHHAVTDAASSSVMVRELAAHLGGERLTPLPAQYADWAAWERSRVAARSAELFGYWTRVLAGVAPLALPRDRPQATHRDARLPLEIPAALAQPLIALGRRERCTPFVVLLALFQALLSRWSAQEDVAVAAPIANRSTPWASGLIGFFVNTVVLRSDLAGEPSLRQLLGRVRATVLGSLAHGEAPFDEVVRRLNPTRDGEGTPLAQVLFNLEEAPSSYEVPGLSLLAEELHAGGALFSLTLTLRPAGGGFAGFLGYDSGEWDRATVARLIDQLLHLAREAVEAPDRPLAELPLFGVDERARLVSLGAGPPAPLPELCVHQRFALTAARTPSAPALRIGAELLSYAELQLRARRLARRLEALGARGQPVAIALEPSLHLGVAVLAVMEAGGACVPLDLAQPCARVRTVLDDAGAPILLSVRHLASLLPPHPRILFIDEEPADGPLEACAPVSLDDTAYILYTSGSTGRPKGVRFPHRALANLIDWHLATYDARGPLLAIAPLAFDASFHELFSTWGAGGLVVLAPLEIRRDVELLGELIEGERIQRIILPVVILWELAARYHDDWHRLASLREVFVTGEALRITRDVVRLFAALGCPIHNHYGPTETHVVTAHRLDGAPESWPILPSIGRPISNTAVYVLDRHREPVPQGVRGEVYIGGLALADGYQGAPQLTRERFIDSPYGRLYRTGDLGRWLADDTLEFLGRGDDQLKIRGHRVEPREIEAALLVHARVQSAAVTAWDDGGGARLAAYVVCADPAPTPAELRSHLSDRLPEAMVPGEFVILPKLPLTPNGKLDRRALPTPKRSGMGAVAPQSETERRIAGIWCEVLRLPSVGVTDDFFAIGGHSLMATQVALRTSRALNVRVLARHVFDHPTVRALASLADELVAAATTSRGV